MVGGVSGSVGERMSGCVGGSVRRWKRGEEIQGEVRENEEDREQSNGSYSNSLTSFFVDFIIVTGDSLSIRILDFTELNMAKFTVLPSHHIFLPLSNFSFSLILRTYWIASLYGNVLTPASDK